MMDISHIFKYSLMDSDPIKKYGFESTIKYRNPELHDRYEYIMTKVKLGNLLDQNGNFRINIL